jgi:hypothetical protein
LLQLAAFRCQPGRQSNTQSDIGDAAVDSAGQD